MPSLSLFRCWAKELHFLRRRSIIAQVFILLDNPLIEYTHTKGALTKSAIIFVKAPFWLVERLIIFVDKMGKWTLFGVKGRTLLPGKASACIAGKNEPLSAHARHFPLTGTAKPRCARGNAVSVYTFPSRARSRPAYGPSLWSRKASVSSAPAKSKKRNVSSLRVHIPFFFYIFFYLLFEVI